jgi:hypothetical protein
MENLIKSKITKIILISVAGVAAALLVFKLGVFVGYGKANFSYRWGESYHRNFAGPRGGFMDGMMRGNSLLNPRENNFVSAHGTFGKILQIDNNELIISTGDNAEKTIVVDAKTTVRRGMQAVATSDIKVGENVVVIGSPVDGGKITAQLIRIFPN